MIKKVEFPGVLILGLKISKGCETNFCGVSRSENPKNPSGGGGM